MGGPWQALSEESQVAQVNTFQGGLNQGLPIFDIQEHESTDEFGFTTDNYPALQTRKDKTAYGSRGPGPVTHITTFSDLYNMRVSGDKLQKWSGSDWVDVATVTAGDYDSTNFNEKILFVNGVNIPKSYDGATLTDLSPNAPTGKYITNDTVRVWIAKDDTLHFSGFLAQSDWTSAENSGSVQYYTPNGGDITGLIWFDNHICVFKRDSFAEIFGTNYNNFKLMDNSGSVGCTSHKSLTIVDNTLFWLGQNDVYAYRGGKPDSIGLKIRKYLDRITPQKRYTCWGSTDGIRYFLGLSIDGATEVNIILVYDPRVGIWRVYNNSDSGLTDAHQWRGAWYIGTFSGMSYTMDSAPNTNLPYQITTKPFDEGLFHTEKEYYEMHIHAHVPMGSTLNLSVSVEESGESFTQLFSATPQDKGQSMNIIIPLDVVPITKWFRYNLSGTGNVTIYKVTRYARVHPTQH